MKPAFLVFFTAFLNAVSAFAAVTFGAEFTFTNQKILNAANGQSNIVNIKETVDAQKDFLEEVLRTCKECRAIVEKNGYNVTTYKVIYPDGWYFIIATDPAVVEVQTKPSTVQTIQKLQERIQKDIFDAAAKAGIRPDANAGGGHIHFDYQSSTARGNVKVLRNLLVDFANHPELAHGIWAYDSYNAPSIAALPEGNREAFKKIVADVDAGKITKATELTTQIRENVYNYNIGNWGPKDKYHAVNINRVGSKDFSLSEQTVEIRSIRAQKNAAEFLAQIQILEGRIELNLTRETLLPLKLEGIYIFENMSTSKMKAHLDYVAEAGVKPEYYLKSFSASLPNAAAYLPLLGTTVPVTVFCKKVFN